MKKLQYDTILIDGSNICYKSMYTNMGLSAKILVDGDEIEIKTSMLYGVIQTLIFIKQQFLAKSGKIIMVWDRPPTRKFELYRDYKCARRAKHKSEPDETNNFYEQLELTKKILNQTCINQAWAEGEEADDVIGTLAQRDGHVLVVSADKDLSQLITNNCHKYYRNHKGRDILMTKENFVQLNGYDPADNIIFQIMEGDAVDSIPGINGLGPKTADKLYREFTDKECMRLREGVMVIPKALEIWLKKRNKKKNIVYNPKNYGIMLERNWRLMKSYCDIENLTFVRGRNNKAKLLSLFETYEFDSMKELKYKELLRL